MSKPEHHSCLFWRGIEINPQYFEIAQRRIAEAQAQLTLNMATA